MALRLLLTIDRSDAGAAGTTADEATRRGAALKVDE
jgi:hypothetical protein